MIDLQRIRRDPTRGRLILEFVVNGPLLLLMLYGVKCVLTRHATTLLSVQGAYRTTLRLRSVTGTTAAVAGIGYLGFGLFLYLSDGSPPAENWGWPWRIGRALLRWGGLLAAIWAFLTTNSGTYDPITFPPGLPFGLVVKAIAFIAGAIVVISFLVALFVREQVKKNLSSTGCTPLHIWWRPCAYWLPHTRYTTGFRVIYLDPAGYTRRTYCVVYPSYFSDVFRGVWRVRWFDAVLPGQIPWIGRESVGYESVSQ